MRSPLTIHTALPTRQRSQGRYGMTTCDWTFCEPPRTCVPKYEATLWRRLPRSWLPSMPWIAVNHRIDGVVFVPAPCKICRPTKTVRYEFRVCRLRLASRKWLCSRKVRDRFTVALRRGAAFHGENGLSSDTLVREMSATFRVTSVSPYTLAVAARIPSISGKGSGTLSRAQTSAIDSSTGSTRSPSPLRMWANHRSNTAACSGAYVPGSGGN